MSKFLQNNIRDPRFQDPHFLELCRVFAKCLAYSLYHAMSTTDLLNFCHQLTPPPWSDPMTWTPSLCLLFLFLDLNCHTMGKSGSVVTIFVSFCVRTARKICLVCCDWEFKKTEYDFQKFDLKKNARWSDRLTSVYCLHVPEYIGKNNDVCLSRNSSVCLY